MQLCKPLLKKLVVNFFFPFHLYAYFCMFSNLYLIDWHG